MKGVRPLVAVIVVFLSLIGSSRAFAAYNLEVPAEPRDEYRLQFKNYSKHLLASYDRAFVDDYEGAVREVAKAIELLPEEGIGFAERGRYHRILNNDTLADNDFKAAITLFNQAIERYRPAADKKTKSGVTRKINPADAVRLVATLRYQRGEAYFNFEQYRKASDDFAAACQEGNAFACSRIWDVMTIAKRGVQWVPLSARQYYDRSRVEHPSPAVVRVWVRREEPQPALAESGSESYIQQHLELHCATREFRLTEALVISNGSQPMAENVAGSGFTKPVTGSAPGKLMIIFCPRQRLKK